MAKILIVDDAAFMRTLLKNILFPKGYEIAGEAENGAIAVEKYKALKPDLVTMDIVMPDKNGIDALKENRAIDPNVGVTMCTAVGQESRVRCAIMSGARGYIVKPFQAPKVLEEVQKVLGS